MYKEDHRTVCIIGAGLGGLFTGAILAHEGLKVTVLEKNATIGGGLQSFKRFGEVFDTGMHVFGGMQEGGNIRRLSEYLGVYDETLFSHVNPQTAERIYVAEDDAYYSIKQGREGFVESLAQYFPDQHENLINYVDAIYRIVDEVPLYQLRTEPDDLFMHSDEFFMSANDFIAKYISDPKLRSVVAYMTPLYSGRADTTPAFLHCLISNLLINGSSRFVGGSDLFANKLRDKIVENGGEVITSEGVCKVNTEGRRITSVTTVKGKSYEADYYISDIHPATLLALFDNPTALPKAFRNRLDELPNAYSAFTVNFKFKPGTFPYLDHTAYYLNHYEDIWNLGRLRTTDYGLRNLPDGRPLSVDRCPLSLPWPLGFLYMTPPEFEQGEFTNKMIVTAPMDWEYVRRWEDTTLGHRTPEYQKWKDECAEAIIQCLEKIYPDFRKCIDKVNTASPLTIRDYYGVKEGSMCGYLKDCNNITYSHIPIVTKIPNLLLTGQCVNLHGFCGVPLTAIKTSEAILGTNFVLNKING